MRSSGQLINLLLFRYVSMISMSFTADFDTGHVRPSGLHLKKFLKNPQSQGRLRCGIRYSWYRSSPEWWAQLANFKAQLGLSGGRWNQPQHGRIVLVKWVHSMWILSCTAIVSWGSLQMFVNFVASLELTLLNSVFLKPSKTEMGQPTSSKLHWLTRPPNANENLSTKDSERCGKNRACLLSILITSTLEDTCICIPFLHSTVHCS